MKRKFTKIGKMLMLFGAFSIGSSAIAQNVYDDIIEPSTVHTHLEAALIQENLVDALKNSTAVTVFAPTDEAFEKLAVALGFKNMDGSANMTDFLASPDIDFEDILKYHVILSKVNAVNVSNGQIADAYSTTNTLKLTKTSTNDVYVNQAKVTGADNDAANGTVHITDAVILPFETVVDVAIDNNFDILAEAVIKAELFPALTNPLSKLTVFAPTDDAFTTLLEKLGNISKQDLLDRNDLADILTYHVLGSKVAAAEISNGDVIDALSETNTLKLTKTSTNDVYINQAKVTGADNDAYNGTVHIIDAVVLPSETVIDVALDNGFSSLATAVITAELLPALTNPFEEFTVFAPTNTAFDNLAAALGTTINGLLALDNLDDILLYHVVSGTVLSSDLSNGEVATLNGENITVDITSGVMINDYNVTGANNTADNGVVHIIDGVLLPSSVLDIEDNKKDIFSIYPNPSSDFLIPTIKNSDYKISDIFGRVIKTGSYDNKIDLNNLQSGSYYINIISNGEVFSKQFVKN